MLQWLIGPVLDIGKTVLKDRSESKAREQEARAAWETAMGRSMENGWKDEYVTVVVTLPLLQSFVGNLVYAVTGNSQILEAQTAFMADLGVMMDTEYGILMKIVVLAAVGIKGLKVLR